MSPLAWAAVTLTAVLAAGAMGVLVVAGRSGKRRGKARPIRLVDRLGDPKPGLWDRDREPDAVDRLIEQRRDDERTGHDSG